MSDIMHDTQLTIRVPADLLPRLDQLRDVIAASLRNDGQRRHLGARFTRASAARMALDAGIAALIAQHGTAQDEPA